MTITENFDINTGDVLVEIHSTTCGVCRKMAPLVSKLVANHTNTRFVDLLTDDEDIGDDVVALAEHFNVATLPTFVHLIDGQVVGQTYGFKQLTQLEADLKL